MGKVSDFTLLAKLKEYDHQDSESRQAFEKFVTKYYTFTYDFCKSRRKVYNVDLHAATEIAHCCLMEVRFNCNFDFELKPDCSESDSIQAWLIGICIILFKRYISQSKTDINKFESYAKDFRSLNLLPFKQDGADEDNGRKLTPKQQREFDRKVKLAKEKFETLNEKEKRFLIMESDLRRLNRGRLTSEMVDSLIEALGLKRSSYRKMRQRIRKKLEMN